MAPWGMSKVSRCQQPILLSAFKYNFDGQDRIVAIERETVRFEALKEVYYTRKQFPLTLAYAITIHKSQGLSLQTALVDAGDRCFGPGMIYVALSRVTMSEGLHLIDLDKTKICADTEALVEYNRLRQKYRPHLPQFTIVKPFKVSKVPEAKKQPLKRDTTTTIGTDKPPKKSKSSAFKDNRRSRSASGVKAEPTNADSKKKANTKRLNTEKVKSLIPPKKTRIETAVNQEYRSGIGPGRRGLRNTDGSACYANAAMQCLFAMQRNLFDVLSLMHGPLAEELKRLATSSLKTYETMDAVRKLLPPQYKYQSRDQQSLCEFWFHLFQQLDAENRANDVSALRSLYQYKIHRFSVCSTCHWSRTSVHLEGTPDCPFPIPGVLNPNEPAINEVIDNSDISFNSVLIPE